MVFERLGKKLNRLGARLGFKNNSFQSRLGNKAVVKKPKTKAQAGMSDEEKLSANIAENVYEKERKNFGDYEYNKDLSDDERGVWYNKKNKKTRIGYKGTNTLKDVRIDTTHSKGNIMTGTQRNNPMYKQDLDHFDKVANVYGKDIALSGHSLGGSRTYNVSKNKNVRGDAFNTGRGWDKQMKLDKKLCNTPNPPPFCDKMTSLRIENDPLSMLNKGAYGQHKTFTKNEDKISNLPHFMGNFTT